jgi:DeoR family transcriptional regulator, suf operon transcriptional repressor
MISIMTRSHMQRPGWNKRLLASTRGQILALLRTENHTVNELAATLKLTGNAVRAQLMSLGHDGLVQPRGFRRGTRKPHVTYGLSAEAEHVFPKAYGLLWNHFLSALSKRLTPSQFRRAMRDVGTAVARDHAERSKRSSRRARIKAALNMLHDLGGSARLDRREGKQFIQSRNGCPLADITAHHSEACLIVEAMLSKIIGARAKTCCVHGEIPHCCFELRPK